MGSLGSGVLTPPTTLRPGAPARQYLLAGGDPGGGRRCNDVSLALAVAGEQVRWRGEFRERRGAASP